jgi:hypothetical protein
VSAATLTALDTSGTWCPANGCVRKRAADHLCCGACWHRLPAEQRTNVNRAWGAFLDGHLSQGELRLVQAIALDTLGDRP